MVVSRPAEGAGIAAYSLFGIGGLKTNAQAL
jgi:hypothetical protein